MSDRSGSSACYSGGRSHSQTSVIRMVRGPAGAIPPSLPRHRREPDEVSPKIAQEGTAQAHMEHGDRSA